jgi:hypothetical protein
MPLMSVLGVGRGSQLFSTESIVQRPIAGTPDLKSYLYLGIQLLELRLDGYTVWERGLVASTAS